MQILLCNIFYFKVVPSEKCSVKLNEIVMQQLPMQPGSVIYREHLIVPAKQIYVHSLTFTTILKVVIISILQMRKCETQTDQDNVPKVTQLEVGEWGYQAKLTWLELHVVLIHLELDDPFVLPEVNTKEVRLATHMLLYRRWGTSAPSSMLMMSQHYNSFPEFQAPATTSASPGQW